jgi:hypothetical protein
MMACRRPWKDAFETLFEEIFGPTIPENIAVKRVLCRRLFFGLRALIMVGRSHGGLLTYQVPTDDLTSSSSFEPIPSAEQNAVV